MLKLHNLSPLQSRRRELRLTLLYKISQGLLPAIKPELNLTPLRNKRRITAKKFNDFQSSNIIEKHQNNNTKGYTIPSADNQYIETLSLLEHLKNGIA